ncbi:MAG: hypothetical protein H6704_14050 [Myxococcales bacterium]|nr:hypothetical protein [Myxococcales bacterium]
MRAPPWRLRFVRGRDLSEERIDEAWALRSALIGLQRQVPVEVDRAAFGRDLRRASRVGLIVDRQDRLQGFTDLAIHLEPGLVVMRGEYGFVAPAWRRHPALALLTVGLMLHGLARHGAGRRVYYVGDPYPTGLRPFIGGFDRVFLAGEPDLPPDVADIVRRYPPLFYGQAWEAQHNRVRLRTIPGELVIRSDRDRAMLTRYERINPGWREGYGAFMVVPVGWSVVPRGLAAALRRGRARGAGPAEAPDAAGAAPHCRTK